MLKDLFVGGSIQQGYLKSDHSFTSYTCAPRQRSQNWFRRLKSLGPALFYWCESHYIPNSKRRKVLYETYSLQPSMASRK